MNTIKLSYANVMATIAVFVALGGTSYPALKLPRNSVGNAQLKANAVTTGKIRNGSVRRGDLARSARVGARGPRGATGSIGARGPAGFAGAIVRTRETAAARPALAAQSYVDVVSAALPAGRWIVTATTGVYSNAPASDNFRCFIVVDGARREFGKVQAAGNAAGAVTSSDVTLIEIVEKTSPAGVVLSCGHDTALPDGTDARFDRAKLVAIPAETIDLDPR
jgi:hypothetical protein